MNKKFELLREAVGCYKANHVSGDINEKTLLEFIDELEQLTIPVVVKSLKDKEAPTLKDAFVAGYKKRALMSGLKYDEVSELNAITNFKCWKSFDLNL